MHIRGEGIQSRSFNTQIFSDILQNLIMTEHYGVHITDEDVTAGNTVYKPESSHNAEAGVKYSRMGRNYRLNFSSSVFYIDCHDQQITVFPPGKTTGRMMRNAGRSHSYGLEAMMSFTWKGLDINASYGYANAAFDKYDDGNQDYSGKHIPYAPQNTIYARASYDFSLSGKLQDIVIGTDWNARGRTWWNEDNSLSDGLHGSLGADFSFRFRKITIFGRLDNLTDARNPVFYFKSVGNSFFQIEKPFRWHIGIRITL
ncbi:MAG: TonB-dependent receptor [Bacteroidales bacterium]|nr:TonB-dependent receptor [Bacteroidales bacterium]